MVFVYTSSFLNISSVRLKNYFENEAVLSLSSRLNPDVSVVAVPVTGLNVTLSTKALTLVVPAEKVEDANDAENCTHFVAPSENTVRPDSVRPVTEVVATVAPEAMFRRPIEML